ncbi:MAG: hypothetical protein HRT91_04225 [Piscirickettsiaceae bacterium]|nr:hypothetical protein [Piscirickettsiaceae bacterium]
MRIVRGAFLVEALQPHNLPNHGLMVNYCCCGKYYGTHLNCRPYCGTSSDTSNRVEWCSAVVEDALEIINSKSLGLIVYHP